MLFKNSSNIYESTFHFKSILKINIFLFLFSFLQLSIVNFFQRKGNLIINFTKCNIKLFKNINKCVNNLEWIAI